MNESKSNLRIMVKESLSDIVEEINSCLSGKSTKKHEETLLRLSSSNSLPHWYLELAKHGVLPNLDGKTVGSVIEQVLVSSIQIVLGESQEMATEQDKN